MMGGEKYVMRVEHDPSGTYSKGAIIPLGEFLIGVKNGTFPRGMRVTKCAHTHAFTVDESATGNLCLRDSDNEIWRITGNQNNWSGYQLHKYITYEKRKKRGW